MATIESKRQNHGIEWITRRQQTRIARIVTNSEGTKREGTIPLGGARSGTERERAAREPPRLANWQRADEALMNSAYDRLGAEVPISRATLALRHGAPEVCNMKPERDRAVA
jgi:hypothetical protein